MLKPWRLVGIAVAGFVILLTLLCALGSSSEGRYARRAQQLSPPQQPAQNVSDKYLILAEKRTTRRDPLNHFKFYRAGWNIRNQNYWASVGYTAAPGFVLAAAWLLFGIVCLLLICCCCYFCRNRLHGKHEGGTLLPLVLLLIFTVAALAGCFLVYIGQAKSHNELSDTLNYVVQQSNFVVGRLNIVSAALSEAQSLTVFRFGLPASDQERITQLNKQIDLAGNNLQNKTKDNANRISSGINRVGVSMVVVVAVMLLLVLLGFLFSMLGAMPLMYLLVSVGWFLVVGTWILCGVYIMLDNTVGDTCIAMKEWVANPSARTSLQDILPCVDINTTNQTLLEVQHVVNDTTTNINTAITQFINVGSVNGLPLVCNPVHPDLSPPSCVNMSDVSLVWAKYVCTSSNTTSCPVQGRLTPANFDQLNKSVMVVNVLYNETPFLLDLENCQYVREVFTTIRELHCHQLRKFLKWQYIGLSLISGGLMFAILLWVVYSRRREHYFFHHNKPVEPKGNELTQKDTE